MYAAILQLAFPPARHDAVAEFLCTEMLPVIRDNDGFLDFRVLDAGVPGQLTIIDTWLTQEHSAAAIGKPEAQAVHRRYAELEISVASATRYTVLASTAD